jgi:hypothetical protein
MISTILLIFIMALAFPIGYLLAYMCKDELLAGRSWFLALSLISFIAGSWFFLSDVNYISLSCFFAAIISGVAYWKSFDKRLTKIKR